MSISAFGIEHTGLSKAAPNDKPSSGRMAAGAYFGGLHSAVAGRKGAKLKATGSSLGHGLAGNAAGSVVGGALGSAGGEKGRLVGSAVGGLAGSLAGNARAVTTNSRKGRYKPESTD